MLRQDLRLGPRVADVGMRVLDEIDAPTPDGVDFEIPFPGLSGKFKLIGQPGFLPDGGPMNLCVRVSEIHGDFLDRIPSDRDPGRVRSAEMENPGDSDLMRLSRAFDKSRKSPEAQPAFQGKHECHIPGGFSEVSAGHLDEKRRAGLDHPGRHRQEHESEPVAVLVDPVLPKPEKRTVPGYEFPLLSAIRPKGECVNPVNGQIETCSPR